jgi:DNA-directed RNA polymerase subunit beta
MQSLGLDVNVVSEEGQRTEMRDEDDDLLRAAEELGIDLSGVRAADDEVEEPAAAVETPEAAAAADAVAGAVGLDDDDEGEDDLDGVLAPVGELDITTLDALHAEETLDEETA